ncbi:hypothetical protein C8J57DRAFT_1054917 [Mycena rebaudengoi]|nr:hypothetical protein C8J57DRAFT_1054917 [Mycena rebaudengoi]
MASVEVVGGLAAGSAPSRSPYGQAPRLGFTHYRAPPHAVPKGGVLVQVWAVGLDSTDLRLLGGTGRAADRTRSRTQSLGRLLGRRVASESSAAADTNNTTDESGAPAQVGFIPGRSFVGRVLECGWEVNDDVVKRGEWVVGLLDVRKSGALAEFITVDRHRIQRVPHPRMNASSGRPASISTGRPTSSASSASPRTPRRPPLTLPELALLPLCGVAAHRAVRTFAFLGTVLEETPRLVRGASAGSMDTMRGAAAVSNGKSGDSHAPDGGGRRRVLVLGGHSGIGGLAARMLVRLGWRVCVHAPAMWFEGKESDGEDDEGMHHEEKGEGQEGRERRYMHGVQERVRAWGAADGGRGATVRAVERLIEDKDVFDAVLDTVGGKEVWEAGEKLLRNGDKGAGGNGGGPKQFTTTVGDWPARPVPTAGDNFKAGLRAMRGNNNATQDEEGGKKAKKAKTKAGKKGGEGASSKSKVRYAWVSCAQDVDWEGEDVRDTLAAVLRLAVEDGVRPHAGAREVPFERAERTFGGGGTLARGESVVVRVAG